MLEHLREFAISDRQRSVLEAVIKAGSNMPMLVDLQARGLILA